MPSDNKESRAGLGTPPTVTPRSSSLHHSRKTNGQENSNTGKPDATNSGSDGEKERVREKLKKTSIAGIRSESRQSEEANSTEKDTDAEPANKELPKEMDVSAGEGSDSDGSTPSSQGRKRSRDPDDVGDETVDTGSRSGSRPGTQTRKRSRELSDEPATKASTAKSPTSSQGKDEDETMSTHATHESAENDGSASTPPAKMDEDPAEPISRYASPSRKLDGRKRVREEGDADQAEAVKIKRPLRKEDESEVPKKTGSRKASSDNLAKLNEKDNEIPAGSGFANTSTISPFATAGGATPLFGGSSGANLFAASKFGAMSGSAASPFATLGSSQSASPFGGLSGSPKPSPFGSPAGKIGGFGSFGAAAPKLPPSGFGALAATSSGDVIAGAPKLGSLAPASKPAKPFGAPEDYDDSESDDDEGNSDDSGDEEKGKKESKGSKPEGFHETTVVTGEENEITICHFRAKSYHFDSTNRTWKERGVGTLKLNANKISLDDADEFNDRSVSPSASDHAGSKRKFRLIMRADAVHKVILNVQLNEKLIPTYGEQGNAPTGNNFRLLGHENGQEVMLLVKLRNPSDAKSLYTHVIECLLGPEAAARKLSGIDSK
ncbi:hypothetical protein DFH27DRAFT_528711 [Peziza echinospora]|nr:hypothetical protein DFH27DRAFT_528711 [Peziza echinospora]